MAGLQPHTTASAVPTEFGQNEHPQAIRVGAIIHATGQDGRLPETKKRNLKKALGFGYSEIPKEIDQAFLNVDHALRTVGGKGWEQVYRVRSYHVAPDDEVEAAMAKNFKKWTPTRKPIWTKISLARVPGREPESHIQIEVEAYDPGNAELA